jgi:hypothetical protein
LTGLAPNRCTGSLRAGPQLDTERLVAGLESLLAADNDGKSLVAAGAEGKVDRIVSGWM